MKKDSPLKTTHYNPKQWIYENTLIHALHAPDQILDPVEIYDCEIQGGCLSGSTLRRWFFEKCTFKDCDLSNLIWNQCGFEHCVFEGCRLIGSDWRQSTQLALQVEFYQCDLSLSLMSDLQFHQVVFEECQCTEIDFTRSSLVQSRFTQTNVRGALFEESNLQDAHLVGALEENFHPNHSNLKGATLSVNTAIRLIEEQGMKVFRSS